jgi:hypothetical protein
MGGNMAKQAHDSRHPKLAELILYISKMSQDDPRFGATKLNKILFFSDFSQYRKRRKSITDDTYQRLENGPAPKHLVPVRDRLIAKKSLAIQNVSYYGKKQARPVALRDADLSLFKAEEIALVDAVIKAFWHKDGTDVSLLSHDFIGWRVAKNREEIPYSVALVTPRELTVSEIAYGSTLEQQARKALEDAA